MSGFGNKDALNQLPDALKALLDVERHDLNDLRSFQTPNPNPPFDERYLPINCDAVSLPCYLIERKHFFTYSAPRTPPACDTFAGERVVFPVHPAEEGHYSRFITNVHVIDGVQFGLRLWAVPTSSTRTMLVWPDGNGRSAYFVKTSLFSNIFGNRRITRRKIAHSIGLSSLVFDSKQTLPAGLSFFHETHGVVPRAMPDAGVIFRAVPTELKKGEIRLLPLFSFLNAKHGRMSLFQKMLLGNPCNAVNFFEQCLCREFARIWLSLALGHGLLIECHAQNLLLEVTPDGATPLPRFWYRDFEGLAVDWELRRALSLQGPKMPYGEDNTYATLGYPHFQSAWCKWKISLYQYLHFVLHALDRVVDESQALEARRAGASCMRITRVFSRQLRRLVREEYGLAERDDYDIYEQPSRFIRFLMHVRRDVMRAGRTATLLAPRHCQCAHQPQSKR